MDHPTQPRVVNSVLTPPKIVTHLSAPTQGISDLTLNNDESAEMIMCHTSDEEGVNDIPAIPGSGTISQTKLQPRKASRSTSSSGSGSGSTLDSGSHAGLCPSGGHRVSTIIMEKLQQSTSPARAGQRASGPQAPGRTPSPANSPLMSLNGSPLLKHYPSRPLSPDLPYRDALYLFCNYSSYMRSPGEGPDGVESGDFRDSVRLLEYARVSTISVTCTAFWRNTPSWQVDGKDETSDLTPEPCCSTIQQRTCPPSQIQVRTTP
jgi:hypothetical protein